MSSHSFNLQCLPQVEKETAHFIRTAAAKIKEMIGHEEAHAEMSRRIHISLPRNEEHTKHVIGKVCISFYSQFIHDILHSKIYHSFSIN